MNEGEVFVRKWPCFCDFCMAEQWNHCINISTVGTWQRKTMKTKSIRSIKHQTLIGKPVVYNDAAEEWIVKAIHGKRLLHGHVEYLIEWEGYSEMTWTKMKNMNCNELIEDWKNNNIVI